MASAAERPPAGLLRPLPWRLEHPPSPLLRSLSLLSSEAEAEARPLPGEPPRLAPPVLLLDRRQAPAIDLHPQLQASLSASERQRHAAYRLSADRERFLLGRGGLRILLGAWLQLPPEAVPLETGPHGKPRCPGGPEFNLSHAGDLILLAVHPERPVGVDVERLRPRLDWPPLARRVLPPAELLALEALPAADRAEGFLAAWCRLEARLKARGQGLAGLTRLRQQERWADGRAPGATAGAGLAPVRDRRHGGLIATGERVWDVAVPTGYRAAVALAPLHAG